MKTAQAHSGEACGGFSGDGTACFFERRRLDNCAIAQVARRRRCARLSHQGRSAVKGAWAMQRSDLAAYLLDEVEKQEHMKTLVGITSDQTVLLYAAASLALFSVLCCLCR